MKALAALPLLCALTACAAAGPAQKPASAKPPLPYAPPPPSLSADAALVCPADVQACPDGGTVGRNPARDCAFDACPAGAP